MEEEGRELNKKKECIYIYDQHMLSTYSAVTRFLGFSSSIEGHAALCL